MNYFHSHFGCFTPTKKFRRHFEKSSGVFYGTIAYENFITINHQESISMNIGIARLSPDDQFCRKIGRTLSAKRVHYISANVIFSESHHGICRWLVFQLPGTKIYVYMRRPKDTWHIAYLSEFPPSGNSLSFGPSVKAIKL